MASRQATRRQYDSVKVRMSSNDKKELEEEARITGMNVPEYIRYVLGLSAR